MKQLVINEKDIEKLGRRLIKEAFELLNDEKMIKILNDENVEEFIREKDKLNKNIIKLRNNYIVTEKFLEKFEGETKDEKYLNYIKGELEHFSAEEIYNILDKMDLYYEYDEDLVGDTKGFLCIYQVFNHYYTYLY